MYYRPETALPGTIEGYTAPLHLGGMIAHVLRLIRTWHADVEQLKQAMPRLKELDLYFIWGEKDKVVPVSTGKKFAQELGKPIVVIPDCAHLPYEERPAEFNRVVLQTLLPSAGFGA